MLENVTKKISDAWSEASLALNVKIGRKVILTLQDNQITANDGRRADRVDVVSDGTYGGSGGRYDLILTPAFTPDYTFLPKSFTPDEGSPGVSLKGTLYFDLEQAQYPKGIELTGRVASVHLAATDKHGEKYVSELRPHPRNAGQVIGVVI